MTAPNHLTDAPTNEPAHTAAVPPPSDAPKPDPFLEADEETQTQMVLEDFKAAYNWLETADLSGYTDRFVAFLDGKMVGTGPDQMDLRDRVGREQQVHPLRVAVVSLMCDDLYFPRGQRVISPFTASRRTNMTAPNSAIDTPANEPIQTPDALPSADASKRDPFLEADRETQFQIVLEDMKAAQHWLETADISGFTDKFVAFLNGKMVGTGKDQIDLRMRVGQEQQVDPFRLAVIQIVNDLVD